MPDANESVINVRSDAYEIASALERCPHCGATTTVVALCLPAGHELFETYDGIAEGLDSETSWGASHCSALIFYVDRLPEVVVVRLQGLCAGYRLAFSPATQAKYWANHCAACDALLEDHDLHCEPDGALMKAFGWSAPRRQWPSFDEPLLAAAGGYTEDPLGFDPEVPE